MSGQLNLGITACDFCIPKTGFSSMGESLLYAVPLEASRVDLDRKKPCLSGETELYDLINEEFPDSMSFLRTRWLCLKAQEFGRAFLNS